MNLNTDQQKAVISKNKRVLVLAGAGSGKTRVIIYRILHLIKYQRVKEDSIIALSFTNKAAKEMKQRLVNLIGPKANKVMLSTFHSFCLSILRQEASKLGFTKSFSIYDEHDLKRVIKELLFDITKEKKDLPVNAFFNSISNIKNKNLNLDEIPKENNEIVKELYLRLQSTLKAYNAFDFDSILSSCKELLEKYPEILKKYQDKYKYILIDEYQDTNPIQYKIAELLTGKNNNLFVVGDDDQAIYGFRGSSIEHILHFKADETIKLQQNYRSSTNILDAANHLIKNNKNRHKKKLWSSIEDIEPITLFHAPSEVDEAKSVIDRAIKLKQEQNLNWCDIAILYRSNILSRNIEMQLVNATWKKNNSFVRGIPYDIYGGLEFAERKEIKDIFAYLKVISNSLDQEALLRIINTPRRCISTRSLEVLTTYNRKHKISLFKLLEKIGNDQIDLQLQSKTISGIKSFVDIIHRAKNQFRKKPLYKALQALINDIDYMQAIKSENKDEKIQKIKYENTQECINALSQYEETTPDNEMSLEHFISNSMLSKDSFAKKNNSSKNRVQVMTLHSSKGLEFKACFLIGLEDHIIPHEKSVMDTSVEEERRLFYVGITRAKKYLTLSMARARKKMGKTSATNPSRFLFEIPKELIQLSSWKVF